MAGNSFRSALGALAPSAIPLRRRRSRLGSWAPFLIPAVVTLVLVGVLPLAYALQLSLTSFSFILPGRTGQWVGLDNYASLLGSASFLASVWRTVVFTVASVVLELGVGLAVALALGSAGRARGALVGLLVIPMVLTPVIIGLMFNFALNPQYGPLTAMIRALGVPGSIDILGSPATALLALILVDVWQWSPFMAIMLWAGMQALPTSPLEAAAVDGATAWQRLRFVMLPMLRPVLVVAIIFRAAEAVREFDKVFVLTGGGPGSATEVLDLFTYRIAFTNWDMSLGSAMGIVIFVAALCAAYLYFRISTRRGQEA